MLIEKYFCIDRDSAQRMIAATENMIYEKSGDNNFQSTKVFLFNEYAVLKMQNITFRNVDTHDPDLKHLERLAGTLLVLQAEGVNVIPILAFQSDNGNGYIVQPRAKGAELYDRSVMYDKNYILERVELLSNVPQEHFDKFIADTIKIIDAGVLIDFIGKDNFFYHDSVGFQFIDLNAHLDYEYGIAEKKPQPAQLAAWNCFIPCYYDTVPQYRDTVSKIIPELDESEERLLQINNRRIFEKCKTAMIKNDIAIDAVNEIVLNERFMPQKLQLGLFE